MINYTLGLVGYPLSHSLSRLYFEEKFRLDKISGWSYELFPLKKISGLQELIGSTPSLVGFNVTIPHKISIIGLLDEIDPVAKEIGAVNTVQISRQKKGVKLSGFNTDIEGFESALVPYLDKHHKNALLLGTGGAARAAAHVLKKLGLNYKMVSREPDVSNLGYHELDRKLMKQYTLIVNCSPVGMYPDIQQAPQIPYEFLDEKHLLFDMVYNPLLTRFLKNGRDRGARIINGLEMLIKQAEKSWEIWNGK